MTFEMADPVELARLENVARDGAGRLIMTGFCEPRWKLLRSGK
jgi:hypothetical protein